MGIGTNILGLAGITNYNETGHALESFAIINCLESQSREEILRAVTHELGHYLGLGHSKLNGSVASQGAPLEFDTTGPEPYELFELLPINPFLTIDNHIEMMFPFQVDNITPEMNQITSDDRASLTFHYPSENLSQETGTIRGFVYDIDGKTPITGVNVIARNIHDPYADAVSNITGTIQNPGEFVLTHLSPNQEYVLFTDNPGSTNGTFSVPFRTANSEIPEEFWNGDRESSDPETDSIEDFETITLSADEVRTDVNFLKNASIPKPGEILDLPGLSTTTVPIGFDFEFCGIDYSMVTISRSGMITFTPVDAALTILGKELFLSRHPSISALSNVLRGEVIYQSSPEKFEVQWGTGSDLNSITLLKSGVFYITYNDNTIIDPSRIFGISGYSCGPSAVNLTETQTDLYTPRSSFLDLFKQKTNAFDNEKQTETLSLASLNQGNLRASFTSRRGNSDSFSVSLSSENENFAQNVRVINSRQKTAVYEMYGSPSFASENGFTEFDLNPEGGLTLVFLPPGPFKDRFEPNNSLATATPVRLPFNSGNTRRHFTRMQQLDVDYYQFCGGKPGEHLLVEFHGPFNDHGVRRAHGQDAFDGALALFDPQGQLLKLDRESGTPQSFGSFPRILYPIADNTPRCFKLAVTSEGARVYFDPFNYRSVQPLDGRYILDIRTVQGELIEFENTGSFSRATGFYKEVELPFSFPFYGNNYSTVFVGSQGDLTFGEGRSRSHRIQTNTLLDGPPTIAALWDRLLLSGNKTIPGESIGRATRGVILTREEDDGTFTIEYKNAGLSQGAERITFSINLRDDGQILLNYPDLEQWPTVGRSIVGVSPGGGVEEPEESDLSQIKDFTVNEQAIIETFDPSITRDLINKRTDLHGITLRFKPEE